jgi:hypothetical protein
LTGDGMDAESLKTFVVKIDVAMVLWDGVVV